MTALDEVHQGKRPESNTPVKEDQLLQPSATRLLLYCVDLRSSCYESDLENPTGAGLPSISMVPRLRKSILSPG